MTVTNQRSAKEEIKRKLNSRNAFVFLCRIQTREEPVYCNCETLPFKLREDDRLKVFENRILRKVFGRKRKYQEA
jgi:hypothetical protein